MKKIIRPLAVMAVFILVLAALDYVLYPCTFIRSDIHRVQTEQVEDLVLGGSHGKMNISPEAMQEVTGRTGLQEVSGETSLKEVPAGTGIQGTALCVEKEDDRGNRIYCLPLPCLVTFTKASFQVRYPLIARILEAESMELPVLSAGDILAENLTGHGISEENSVKAGPDKAAMQVQEVELRKMDKQSQIIEDPDPVKAVTVLAQRLFSEGIL